MADPTALADRPSPPRGRWSSSASRRRGWRWPRPSSTAAGAEVERGDRGLREGRRRCRAGLTGPVPPHLRDAHYPGAATLGSGQGYRYPHDLPGWLVSAAVRAGRARRSVPTTRRRNASRGPVSAPRVMRRVLRPDAAPPQAADSGRRMPGRVCRRLNRRSLAEAQASGRKHRQFRKRYRKGPDVGRGSRRSDRGRRVPRSGALRVLRALQARAHLRRGRRSGPPDRPRHRREHRSNPPDRHHRRRGQHRARVGQRRAGRRSTRSPLTSESITGNVSALTSVFAATLGGPVIKVAAFSYGVRRAASRRSRAEYRVPGQGGDEGREGGGQALASARASCHDPADLLHRARSHGRGARRATAHRRRRIAAARQRGTTGRRIGPGLRRATCVPEWPSARASCVRRSAWTSRPSPA